MKKYFVIGICLLTIFLSITIYYEIEYHKLVNIHDITSIGAKNQDVKVYLDTTFVAGTVKSEKNHSYYVMFGDGVQYLVYIDNSKANEINEYLLNHPDKSYRIEGVTKLISQDLIEPGKKFVNTWLNNNHHEIGDEHSHEITDDDFYHYFGHVYLDVKANNLLIKIIIYITGTMGILMIFYYFEKKYHLI